jgi:hypothetical protein
MLNNRLQLITSTTERHTMIKVYATLNNVEQLLDTVSTAKEIHPLIAYYTRKGYTNFRIVE